ncbi:unnamed protein product [Penicillium olsonii]|nr:unnamed protein product [Penicillium olsonii]
MSLPSKTVALFGANGEMGKPVFKALTKCQEPRLKVIAFVSPNSDFDLPPDSLFETSMERVDLYEISTDELAGILKANNVEVVLSALGGQVILKQRLIQDAAAIAGVKRFYPSEYGMHQIAWMPDGEAYIHPTWAVKIKCFEDAIRHPAIQSGQMTYTVIGCGECFDCPGEPILCPWLEKDNGNKNGYTIQCVGNPDAKTDYSSRTDTANFLVATLRHPELSENKYLGFRNDYISHREIANLLERYSGKPTKLNVTSVEQMKEYLQDPSSAPDELQQGSTFDLDFWMLLRYVQGRGDLWRPPGTLHNDLFPEVRPVSVEEYFKNLFGGDTDAHLL